MLVEGQRSLVDDPYGIDQVITTCAIAYLIVLGFGMDGVTAVYVAVALTFSSMIWGRKSS